MDEASIWTQTAREIAATIMTAMTTAVTMIVIGDVVVSFPLILDLVDAALVTDVVAGVAEKLPKPVVLVSSPTGKPVEPFNMGKPFHSVLSATWTICFFSC